MNATSLIVGCTRRKAAVTAPVPAYRLYEGGLVRPLRGRLGTDAIRWTDVSFLSARHGLVRATELLLPYDERLTADTVRRLSLLVQRQFVERCAAGGAPERLLVACEPAYAGLLTHALRSCPPPVVCWVSDIRAGWPHVAAVLDWWGWP